MANSNDTLQRFLFRDGHVRGEIVRLTTSFQTIQAQRHYPPAVSQILGEALGAICLLSGMVKMDGRMTLQFQGKPPLKLLLTQCDNAFNIRGIVQWQGELSADDIEKALQTGTLAILVSSDHSVKHYQGIIEWQGQSLAHSIEAYFKQSEQLPTRFWLAVNQHSVVGLMLQAMPNESLEESDDWNRITLLTETVTAEELLTLDQETLFRRLYSQETLELFKPHPIAFGCACSTQRSENALLLLSPEEIEQELNESEQVVVTCEFCNKHYTFDRAAIEKIRKGSDNPH